MEDYATCLQKCYDDALKDWKAAASSNPADIKSDSEVDGQQPLPKKRLEAPLKPNPVKPYNASLFGLDSARTACRFEMIKIVREVDAVTADPKVAIDSDRVNEFLNPCIFRLLVPKLIPTKAVVPPIEDPSGTRYVANTGQKLFNGDLNTMHPRFKDALAKADLKKAPSFQYSDIAAGDYMQGGSEYQTHLDVLTTDMPAPYKAVLHYTAEGFVDAIGMAYGPHELTLCNARNDAPSQDLGWDGKIVSVTVIMNIYPGTGSGYNLTGLLLIADDGRKYSSGAGTKTWPIPAPAGYSLRGFGVVKGARIDRVSVIWGLDP